MENTVLWPTQLECDVRAAGNDGKVGCKTVECTTDLLYSDCLYYLWHGIRTALKAFQISLEKRNTYD